MVRQYNKHSQQGFTIIEVMVAITLSLILLYGVTEIFLGSRTSYRLQTGMARAQENARFALDFMSRSISMAGAYTMGIGSGAGVKNTSIEDWDENNALGFTRVSGTASDEIVVTYQSATDCVGNPGVLDSNGASIATDKYSIGFDSGVSNLYCNNTPLVEGIENMQILYGEDRDGDGAPDVYVNRDQVSDLKQVAAVRVAILASTVDNAGVTNTASYHLLNAPTLGPFNDKLGRRVYTRTILLRNYNPDLL